MRWETMLAAVLVAEFVLFSIAVAVFPERRHAVRRDLQFHRARDGRACRSRC